MFLPLMRGVKQMVHHLWAAEEGLGNEYVEEEVDGVMEAGGGGGSGRGYMWWVLGVFGCSGRS